MLSDKTLFYILKNIKQKIVFFVIKRAFYIFCLEKQKIVLNNNFQTNPISLKCIFNLEKVYFNNKNLEECPHLILTFLFRLDPKHKKRTHSKQRCGVISPWEEYQMK